MKKIAILFLTLSLFLSLAPAAFADEADVEGKSWDELVQALLEEHHAEDGEVTLGYYNTVTGEEQFYDPDRYMIAASMYKVPLTMVFADKEAAEEIAWDDLTNSGYRYSVLVEGAIVNSNNDYAAKLWKQLGSYHEYRRIIAPYMGEDPDNVDDKYYENNFFTARQMITCLKNLYDGRETYSTIIDMMKRAQQDQYFCAGETRYDVAHKYGYLVDDARRILYLNDCGIVYTEDPYVLVCFTAGVEKPYGVLSEYITLMSDYTQAQRTKRLQEEEAAAKAEEEARARAAEEAARAEAAGTEPEEPGVPEDSGVPGEGSTSLPENSESPARLPDGDEQFAPPKWPVPAAAALISAVCAMTVALRRGRAGLRRLPLALLGIFFSLGMWYLCTSPVWTI